MPRKRSILEGADPSPIALRRQWGKAIAERRDLIGMTRHQLAEAVGVTDQAVGTWERGESSPSPARQVAIAHALGISWAHLFKPEVIAC